MTTINMMRDVVLSTAFKTKDERLYEIAYTLDYMLYRLDTYCNTFKYDFTPLINDLQTYGYDKLAELFKFYLRSIEVACI